MILSAVWKSFERSVEVNKESLVHVIGCVLSLMFFFSEVANYVEEKWSNLRRNSEYTCKELLMNYILILIEGPSVLEWRNFTCVCDLHIFLFQTLLTTNVRNFIKTRLKGKKKNLLDDMIGKSKRALEL